MDIRSFGCRCYLFVLLFLIVWVCFVFAFSFLLSLEDVVFRFALSVTTVIAWSGPRPSQSARNQGFHRLRPPLSPPHLLYLKLDDALRVVGARGGQDTWCLVVGPVDFPSRVRLHRQQEVVAVQVRVVEPVPPVHTQASGTRPSATYSPTCAAKVSGA